MSRTKYLGTKTGYFPNFVAFLLILDTIYIRTWICFSGEKFMWRLDVVMRKNACNAESSLFKKKCSTKIIFF